MLDRAFVNVDCPNCGYGVDVQIISVRLESTIFCSCCKMSIQLVDEGASVYGSQEDMESALMVLERELKMLDTTITFKI